MELDPIVRQTLGASMHVVDDDKVVLRNVSIYPPHKGRLPDCMSSLVMHVFRIWTNHRRRAIRGEGGPTIDEWVYTP